MCQPLVSRLWHRSLCVVAGRQSLASAWVASLRRGSRATCERGWNRSHPWWPNIYAWCAPVACDGRIMPFLFAIWNLPFGIFDWYQEIVRSVLWSRFPKNGLVGISRRWVRYSLEEVQAVVKAVAIIPAWCYTEWSQECHAKSVHRKTHQDPLTPRAHSISFTAAPALQKSKCHRFIPRARDLARVAGRDMHARKMSCSSSRLNYDKILASG